MRAGLSLLKLAKSAGFKQASSLQRYEDPDYMKGRKVPVEIIAKIVPALAGKGLPPITKEEVWRLSEPGSAIFVSSVAVITVPVFPWDRFARGARMIATAERLDSLDVAGMAPGNYAATIVPDDHCELIAPEGSVIVIDLDDAELRDGRRYMIVLSGEPRVRRYHTNPERWESECSRSAATIYPREAVHVIGRCVRVIKEL